jgi:hypothetical protein
MPKNAPMAGERGRGPMVQRVDYYALLSRAVESLELDAYAARGAVYDREHKALLKRLISSRDPCTDADIALEERAFRDAVRRIEFPGAEVAPARAAPRESAEASWPGSSREKARAARREIPLEPVIEPDRAPPGKVRREVKPAAVSQRDATKDAAAEETTGKPRGREIEPDEREDHGPSLAWEQQKPRSILKPAAAYVLVTAAVLGAGALAYAYMTGALDLAWLGLSSGQSAAPQSQRAILLESGQSGRTGKPVEGKATWRTRVEPDSSTGKPDTVVSLEAEIADPHIVLTMTLSRVSDAGAGMSHLLELQFAKPDQLPFGGISRISNMAMKGTETGAGAALVGHSINIAPGRFMFGLLGVADVVKQNVEGLRTQNWLDFTIVFANGMVYSLTIEKGPSGERAIKEALAKWGQ